MQYLPRLADEQLMEKLSYAGAVCIRGPKWCGKTTTAEQRARSALYMQDPDEAENNLMLAETRPSLLLRGERPRLIDEWQDAPQLWDAVRFSVDREQLTGGYILTGSAVPGKQPRHTGTGRISYLDMRTMSLSETEDSTGEVSLGELFEGELDPEGYSEKNVEDLSYLICRGGWPRAVTASRGASLHYAADYVDAVCNEDVSRVDGVSRDPQSARLILREYARLTATAASLNTVRADLAAHGRELSKDTVNSYLSAMRKIYTIEDLESWSPSLRARSRISKTPARFLSDPSIAAAALGTNPDGLLRDMATFGVLFESLCVRDLRAYLSAMRLQRTYRYPSRLVSPSSSFPAFTFSIRMMQASSNTSSKVMSLTSFISGPSCCFMARAGEEKRCLHTAAESALIPFMRSFPLICRHLLMHPEDKGKHFLAFFEKDEITLY